MQEAAELSAAIQIGRQRACQRQWALHVKEGERLNELQAARHISWGLFLRYLFVFPVVPLTTAASLVSSRRRESRWQASGGASQSSSILLVSYARITEGSWVGRRFDDVEADALRSFAPYGSSPPLTDQGGCGVVISKCQTNLGKRL